MHDKTPAHLMTPERIAMAKAYGLAQAIPYTPQDLAALEGVPERAPEAVHDQPPTTQPTVPVRALALVGQAITGREWLVVQVPGGQVRYEGIEQGAKESARRLAREEGAEFAVLRPMILCAPKTILHEEVLTDGD